MAKIVLCGFMGSGKTTIGRELSKNLNIPFFDLDSEIERRVGKRINKIFQDNGEHFFREIEKDTLFEFLKRKEDFVLAVGGGAIIDTESLNAVLKNSIPILLDGRPEVFYERIKGDRKRPLLNSLSNFTHLFEQRRDAYLKIPIKIDAERNPSDVVSDIMWIIKRRELHTPQKIILQVGISFSLPSKEFDFLIIDENVYKIYRERFKIKDRYIVRGGERAKNLKEVSCIYDALSNSKVERDGKVVGVGGGVVSDISGFISSTYMRGVNLYLVPTTLLSQVDSSIGGKNGINLSSGKNLVGTFYLPKYTYIDPMFLWTLPHREIASGLGEIFKYGILSENGIFETLEESYKFDFMTILRLIYPSILEKIRWIENDMFDNKGERIFLNLGHTVGHMMEKIMGFGNLTHGEAVAFGILVSAYISNRSEILKDSDFERIVSLYKKLGFHIDKFLPILNFKEEDLIRTLLLDKKTNLKKLTLILPKRIGEVFLKRDFQPKLLTKFLLEFLKEFKEEI